MRTGRASAATRAVRTGRNLLDQDTWWTDREGITRLIDDLSDDHRRYIARMLIDQAARIHYKARHGRIVADYWAYDNYMEGWADCSELTEDQIRREIRSEQTRGAHLAMVRESPLFRRIIRDLTWLHPGVL